VRGPVRCASRPGASARRGAPRAASTACPYGAGYVESLIGALDPHRSRFVAATAATDAADLESVLHLARSRAETKVAMVGAAGVEPLWTLARREPARFFETNDPSGSRRFLAISRGLAARVAACSRRARTPSATSSEYRTSRRRTLMVWPKSSSPMSSSRLLYSWSPTQRLGSPYRATRGMAGAVDVNPPSGSAVFARIARQAFESFLRG
jgi:hypothetical protein